MRRSKKRLNKYLLLVLLLAISIGFAFLSTTLKINGIFGVKGNTWDIHWENVQPNTNSTGVAETPTIDNSKTIVTYDVSLELPGEYYEFDVDAKNDGTIPAQINEIRHSMRKVVEEGQDSTVPSYIKYSLVYKGTTVNPTNGDILDAGEAQTYTIRVEFDKDATEVPEEDITIRIEDEIDYGQFDPRGKYKITFNPNGGSASPKVKYVEEGQPIGTLPGATREGKTFVGWYTDAQNGTRIIPSYVPTGNTTLYAHWKEELATFANGGTFNIKVKKLAGTDASSPWTQDTNITSITRSQTAPNINSMTDDNIVSSSDSKKPIYAWYNNGTIYYWSEAETEFMNVDSGYMFTEFEALTSLDTSTMEAVNVQNMGYTFAFMTSMTTIDLSNLNTSNVINMGNTFYHNSALTDIDVSGWDTSKVSNMGTMFTDCSSLTSLDLSNFNTSNVANMSSMFYGANSLTELKLNNFDFSKYGPSQLMTSLGVTKTIEKISLNNAVLPVNSESLVDGYQSLEEISLRNADTSKTMTMKNMFYDCQALTSLNLSSFDTSKVQNMKQMFYNCKALTALDLSSFNTSNVTDMYSMFYGSGIVNLDVSNFNTSKVTDMRTMFYNMPALENLNISNFDFRAYGPTNGYTINGMVNNNSDILNKLTMDNVIFPQNMYACFSHIKVKELSLKNADTSNVTNMNYAFGFFTCDKHLDLSSFDTSNVTNMYEMFYSSGIVTIDVSSFDTSHVTNMESMFCFCKRLTDLDISNFEIGQISSSNLSHLVYDCDNLVSLNVSNLDLSNKDYTATIRNFTDSPNNIKYLIMDNVKLPANVHSELVNFTKLEYLSTRNIDTSRVTTMTNMFDSCEKLKVLDLTSFDTRNVTNMDRMFIDMPELTTIYVGDNWSTNNVSSSTSMFNGATNLVGGSGTTYDANNIDKTYAHIDEGQSNKGYLTRRTSTTNNVVTYNANGGTVSTSTRNVISGDSIMFLPIPSRNGYTFTGWYTDPTSGTKRTGEYIPTGNITIYARWTKNQ